MDCVPARVVCRETEMCPDENGDGGDLTRWHRTSNSHCRQRTNVRWAAIQRRIFREGAALGVELIVVARGHILKQLATRLRKPRS